jgi:hypothetical protein
VGLVHRYAPPGFAPRRTTFTPLVNIPANPHLLVSVREREEGGPSRTHPLYGASACRAKERG